MGWDYLPRFELERSSVVLYLRCVLLHANSRLGNTDYSNHLLLPQFPPNPYPVGLTSFFAKYELAV